LSLVCAAPKKIVSGLRVPDKDPRLSMDRGLLEHAKNYNNTGDCGARFKNGRWIGGFERSDT